MKNNNSICSFRWSYPIYYMFDQSMGYCCRTPAQYISPENADKYEAEVFTKMDYFQKRRLEMLEGIRHEDCISCWKLEDNGIQSPRLYSNFEFQMQKSGILEKNETLQNLADNELKKEKVSADASPDIVEIVLSNLCNAKCVYCNEFYSTSWLQEKKRTRSVSDTYFDKQRNSRLDQLFWKWFEDKAMKTVNRIGFIGGEPLLIPELYECLFQINEIANRLPQLKYKPEICITTNLSINDIYLNKFIDLAQQMNKNFKFVIQVSLESVGKQTEYIRFGTNWKLIESNIEKLLSLNNLDLEIAVLPTMNILAIPTIEQFLLEISRLHKKFQKDIKILSNTVTDPSMLNPSILSKNQSHYVIKAAEYMQSELQSKMISDKQKEFFNEYLLYLNNLQKNLNSRDSVDIKQLELLHLFLQKNDLLRQTNFKNIFPEIASIIEMELL